MRNKILLVDDDKDILEILSYNLRKVGVEVQTATDGLSALKKAKKFIPDLIILDVMMPNMDGMETCEKLREITDLNDVIITFFTARSEDYSQIAGLDAGADDYISKPIRPKVLVSKVQSLLRRRTKPTNNKNNLIFRDITIDKLKYKVSKAKEEVKFTKKEFELLALLFSDPGKLFTREEIMRLLWVDDAYVGDRTIDVHIRKLRQKLGDDLISTIKGMGYKLKE